MDGRSHKGARIAFSILVAVAMLDLVSASRNEVLAVPAGPNVLIILIDDGRQAGIMGVLPHVRKWFGREGRTYPEAFDTTPLCCPSRASEQTGLYAHNHG